MADMSSGQWPGMPVDHAFSESARLPRLFPPGDSDPRVVSVRQAMTEAAIAAWAANTRAKHTIRDIWATPW